MNLLLDLFLTFAKIGLFTFGGGYAMIAMIENDCVERKKWITHDEMMNITVIAESTPGPIAINCATFTGYRQAGFSGALFAQSSAASFAVIYLISMFLDNFLELTLIAKRVQGHQNRRGDPDPGCSRHHDPKNAQPKAAPGDHGLLLRRPAVRQPPRVEFFFHPPDADRALVSLSIFIVGEKSSGEVTANDLS